MTLNPIIFIPGITATSLIDYYPMSPDAIWRTLPLLRSYRRVRLHPDNTRFEQTEPAQVRPGQIFSIIYENFIDELREELAEAEDKPVPVYLFGYDWRQPLTDTAKKLKVFMDEVMDRTALLPAYASTGYRDNPQVTLIGHSMGGLLIAGMLAKYPHKAKVDRVVTIGTPFNGSLDAVAKMVIGRSGFDPNGGKPSERQAARVTPALYHLLPSFEGAIKVLDGDDDVGPWYLFEDIQRWQPSILKEVDAYVKRFSLEERTGAELVSSILKSAMRYLKQANRLKLGNTQLQSSENWLAIAGTEADTVTHMSIRQTKDGPVFELPKPGTESDNKEVWHTGDGTVPFASAVPTFLETKNLVCFTPDDFDFWEFKDRFALLGFIGFHGMLPNLNSLQRCVVRYLKRSPDKYGNATGRPAPGVEHQDWKSPLIP